MYTLRIEHPVADFDAWKRAFDADPVDRQRSGVRRYQVLRAVEEPSLVMIDLEFDSVGQAQGLLDAMRGIWAGPARSLVSEPEAWIAEQVEEREL